MGCLKKVCRVALLVVLIIILLNVGNCSKSSMPTVNAAIVPIAKMPDVAIVDNSNPILLDEPNNKKCEGKAFTGEKTMGNIFMSNSNSSWYDTVYNGGTLTNLN